MPGQSQSVPPKRPRSKGLIGAVITLSLFLVSALVVGGYFWYSADRWHAVSQAWEDQAITQGAVNQEVLELLEVALTDLELTRAELESATARITDLAADTAQLGDQQVMTQAQFDAELAAHQHNIEVAISIATVLANCVDGQTQIITALESPGRYTPESVALVRSQTNEICQSALTANAQLQRELG